MAVLQARQHLVQVQLDQAVVQRGGQRRVLERRAVHERIQVGLQILEHQEQLAVHRVVVNLRQPAWAGARGGRGARQSAHRTGMSVWGGLLQLREEDGACCAAGQSADANARVRKQACTVCAHARVHVCVRACMCACVCVCVRESRRAVASTSLT